MPIPPDDPFLGEWRFNREESQYEFGPMPEDATYTFKAEGEQYRVIMAWTMDGQRREMDYTGIPDGKDYPYESPAVDAMSMTRVDARTLDTTAKKDGQTVSYGSRVLSEDGRTMRITMSGYTPEGNWYTNLAVYERV